MRYLQLFLTFFKIGIVTFGGGYAMLPLVEEEMLNKHWMTMEEIVDFLAVSESTPGPFAVNMSTYVGKTVAGVGGAFCATFGVVLPSFVIILLVAKCYQQFQKNRFVNSAMEGIRPVVVGLIATAVITVFQTVLTSNHLTWTVSKNTLAAILIFGCGLFLSRKKVHPILILCSLAFLGILAGIVHWI